jgi:hypothetical protein
MARLLCGIDADLSMELVPEASVHSFALIGALPLWAQSEASRISSLAGPPLHWTKLQPGCRSRSAYQPDRAATLLRSMSHQRAPILYSRSAVAGHNYRSNKSPQSSTELPLTNGSVQRAMTGISRWRKYEAG